MALVVSKPRRSEVRSFPRNYPNTRAIYAADPEFVAASMPTLLYGGGVSDQVYKLGVIQTLKPLEGFLTQVCL